MHTLFMLTPWKEVDKSGPYYCPDCGIVEGFFYYSPAIRDKICILSIDFPRPRNQVIELLGIENQDCPVLVLEDGVSPPDNAQQSMSTGKFFINDPLEICKFLGNSFNGVQPHP